MLKFDVFNIRKILILNLVLLGIISTLFTFNISQTDAITKFDIQLTNGTHFNPFMEGKFIITGEASENIIKLELIFNNIKIFEEVGQSLVFSFNTNNFSKGNVNITLRGHINQDTMIQITRNCIFIGPELRFLIIGIASSMVVIGSLWWVGIRRKKKREKTN